LSRTFAASANRRFQFQKRGQLFIRVHNETLSIAAMCVGDPDRSASQSIADAQPQLQPALLRLSAIISQYRIWRVEIAKARERLPVEKSFSRGARADKGVT
jgi:hypothetical protein